jgi:predicted transcriptional regulator
MFISNVCTNHVQTCTPDASILQVAQQMRRANVGDVVIVEDRNGEPVPIGVVTDRDLVIHIMAKNLNPNDISVTSLPLRKLITAYEGEQLEVATQRMRWSGVRRIPLVDSGGALIGIICLDDIVKSLASTLEQVLCIGRNQVLEEHLKLN